MGKMILNFAIGLQCLSMLLSLIGMCMKQFNNGYYVTIKEVFTVELWTLNGQFKWKSKSAYEFFYGAAGTAHEQGDGDDGYDDLPDYESNGYKGLAELQKEFCAPFWLWACKGCCAAAQSAYNVGMFMVFAQLVNYVLQGTSVFLTWQYMTGNPKKKYRELSMIFTLVGTGLMMLMYLMYWFLCLHRMSNVEILGRTAMTGMSRGGSTMMGFFILCTALVAQIVSGVLYQNAKTSDERRYREAKEQAEFEAEMASVQRDAQMMQQMYGGGMPQSNMGMQRGSQMGYGGGGGYGGGYGGQMGSQMNMGGGQMPSSWAQQPQMNPFQSQGMGMYPQQYR